VYYLPYYERVAEDRELVRLPLLQKALPALQSVLARGRGVGAVYLTIGDAIRTTPACDIRHLAEQVTRSLLSNQVIQGTDLLAQVLLSTPLRNVRALAAEVARRADACFLGT
jgi:hypothetical protein